MFLFLFFLDCYFSVNISAENFLLPPRAQPKTQQPDRQAQSAVLSLFSRAVLKTVRINRFVGQSIGKCVLFFFNL